MQGWVYWFDKTTDPPRQLCCPTDDVASGTMSVRGQSRRFGAARVTSAFEGKAEVTATSQAKCNGCAFGPDGSLQAGVSSAEVQADAERRIAAGEIVSAADDISK